MADALRIGAVISPCARYRYALWRDVQPSLGHRPDEAAPTVLFVMLNPSTADATQNDPTLRRCIGFAEREGYARLAVANLYALRSPSPMDIPRADDPVGPECDQWIADLAADANRVVVAWGADSYANADRVARVRELLQPHNLFCLGTTANGAPRHPLYVRADQPLEAWPA
jgi:hypothetical protein